MESHKFAINLLDFIFSEVWKGDISADPRFVTDGTIVFDGDLPAVRILAPLNVDLSLMIPGIQTAMLCQELRSTCVFPGTCTKRDTGRRLAMVASETVGFWFDCDYMKMALWLMPDADLFLSASGWLRFTNKTADTFLLRAIPR